MDSVDRLAQKIAEIYKLNRNPPSTAPRVGNVISASPLKITWGDQVILAEDKLRIPRGMILEAGDQVAIMPDEGFKKFFVMNILE